MALIPAREGSKGIPKKNIIDLRGYPLVAYSIAVAQLSKLINRVIVTTDSREIAAIAKSYGAEVPFLRPKKYARDYSLDIEFFRHALNWLEKKERYFPDLVIHLRPTTPARNYKVIDRAILKIMSDKKATALRSAELLEHSAYKYFRKKGDYINFFGREDFKEGEEYYNWPRQILPPTYRTNDYVDIILPETLKKTGTLHGKRIRAFIIKKTALIDSPEDLALAKKLLKDREYSPLIKLLAKIKKNE